MNFYKHLLLLLWSVLLTALTVVLGAIPLRAMRQGLGSLGFWLLVLPAVILLMIFNWWFLAGTFLTLAIMVGLFTELEERGQSLITSSMASIGITSLVIFGAVAFWISHHGPSWQVGLTGVIETYMAQATKAGAKIPFEAKDILQQIPSLIVLIQAMALFLSLIFQRRTFQMSGLKRAVYHKLQEFRLPDWFIWVFLCGLASFVEFSPTWIKPVTMNVLNISMAAFFFQGLAVVASYFSALKMSVLWQTILFFILASQLFILACAIGVVDYWLDFRLRLNKRIQELDRGNS